MGVRGNLGRMGGGLIHLSRIGPALKDLFVTYVEIISVLGRTRILLMGLGRWHWRTVFFFLLFYNSYYKKTCSASQDREGFRRITYHTRQREQWVVSQILSGSGMFNHGIHGLSRFCRKLIKG